MSGHGPVIATIVEGEGEVTAVPVVLRRLAQETLGHWTARFPQPHRYNRNLLAAPGGIERIVGLVAARTPDAGAILVLLDADDDCPATLAPSLLARARAARPDRHIAVVLANREFEAWFLASTQAIASRVARDPAAPSLAGIRGLAPDLKAHPDPENPRGCKEWLTHQRIDGQRYRPAADQSALAAAFNLTLARQNSPSFDKFCRDVERLLTAVSRKV